MPPTPPSARPNWRPSNEFESQHKGEDRLHSGCQGKYELRREDELTSSEEDQFDHKRKRRVTSRQQVAKGAKKGGATLACNDGRKRTHQPSRNKSRASKLSQRDRLAGFSSPSNKALLETDPLFHLYLICVGLITLSILAIKCLIPGMPIYTHTVIGFAFLLAIIFVSTIYTQFKSKKVSLSVLSTRDGSDGSSPRRLAFRCCFARIALVWLALAKHTHTHTHTHTQTANLSCYWLLQLSFAQVVIEW